MQPAMSDSKPKTVVTSPYLEDGRLKSEDPNFKSMKTITATTNLQGKNSILLLKMQYN